MAGRVRLWIAGRLTWPLVVVTAAGALVLVATVALAVVGLRGSDRAAGPVAPTGQYDPAREPRLSGMGSRCDAARRVAARSDPAVPTPAEGPAMVLAFGRDRGVEERVSSFAVSDPDGALPASGCVQTALSPFVRDSGGGHLALRGVRADGWVRGDTVYLRVRVDRRQPLGPAGSYVGTVSVVDPRVVPASQPLQVGLAWPSWQWPFALLLAALVPAVVYLWLLKGSFSERGRLSYRDFAGYLMSRNGLMAVGTGLGASVAVFAAVYLADATWGGDVREHITLFTSMFSAFIAAATAVTAAGSDSSATTR